MSVHPLPLSGLDALGISALPLDLLLLLMGLALGGMLGYFLDRARLSRKARRPKSRRDTRPDQAAPRSPGDEKATGRRVRRLELLRELNGSLARSMDFAAVVRLFNDLVPRRCLQLGLGRVRLLLLDDDGLLRSHSHFADTAGVELIAPTTPHTVREIATRVLKAARPALIDGAGDSDPVEQAYARQLDAHSVLVIPVMAKDRSLGVLEIAQSAGDKTLDPNDMEFFSLLADQLGAIIENARLVTGLRKAERETRESEQKYRLLAENSSDLIWTVDQMGRYTYISPSVERLLGCSAEEMRSRAALTALTPGPDVRLGEQRLRELGIDPIGVHRPGGSLVEHQLTRGDGGRVWVETRATALRDNSGEVVGYQGVTRDVDERVRTLMALQASERRFRAIFEDSMEAIFILRCDQSIADVNPMGCHILRRSRDELLATNWRDLILLPESESLDLERPDVEIGRQLEALALRSDGRMLSVELTISSFDGDEAEQLFLSVIRDISERREATRRQRVMDRRMRGIVEAADALIGCPSTSELYRRAIEMARHKLGLFPCAILCRDGNRIRGTWGFDDDGNAVDRHDLDFPATSEWLQLFGRSAGEARAVFTQLSVPTDSRGAIKFPSESWSIASQIRNAANHPIALFIAEVHTPDGRDAADIEEVVAIFSSLLGGIVERKLIEDAIKKSEERVRAAYQAKQREMDKIAEVHSRLLPSRFDPAGGLHFAAQCRPSADVGGDFYQVFPLHDGRVAVLIADVSGHGARAAVATATSRALIQTALREMSPAEGPATILQRVSSWLEDQLDDEQFVTIWLGIWHPATSLLTYASCAHHPAVHRSAGGSYAFLPQQPSLPVGITGVQLQTPREQQIHLTPGERIILYTDGWVETPAADGRLLEGDAFLQFLSESEDQPLDQIALFLFTNFERFAANTCISDDVTLLVFEYAP